MKGTYKKLFTELRTDTTTLSKFLTDDINEINFEGVSIVKENITYNDLYIIYINGNQVAKLYLYGFDVIQQEKILTQHIKMYQKLFAVEIYKEVNNGSAK